MKSQLHLIQTVMNYNDAQTNTVSMFQTIYSRLVMITVKTWSLG